MSRLRRKKLAESNKYRYIQFEDSAVEALCVSNFDTTGNGKVSKREAAKVTDLYSIFDGKSAIKSFKELKYFLSLKTVKQQAFRNCNALTEIELPPNVEQLGDQSFYGCSVLTTIGDIPSSLWKIDGLVSCSSLEMDELPETVTYIGNISGTKIAWTKLPSKLTYIGNLCNDNIALVSIPDGVTSLGSYCFIRCHKLALESLPANLTYIGERCFYEDENIIINSIPDSVTEIGSQAFQSCTKLQLSHLSEGLTSISNRCFNGCTNLNVKLPSKLVSVGAAAFEGCSNMEITELPDTIEQLNEGCFRDCKFPSNLTKFPANLKLLTIGVFYDANFEKEGTFAKDKLVVTPSSLTDLTWGTMTSIWYRVSGYIKLGYITSIDGMNCCGSDTIQLYILPNTISKISTTGYSAAMDFGRTNNAIRYIWQDGGSASLVFCCSEYYLLSAMSVTLRDFPSNLSFTGSSQVLGSGCSYSILRSTTPPTLSNTSTGTWNGKIFIYESDDAAYTDFFSKACGNASEVKGYIGSSDWVTAMQALAKEEGYYDEENECWLDVFADEDYDWTDEYVDYDIYGVDRPEKDSDGKYKTYRNGNV